MKITKKLDSINNWPIIDSVIFPEIEVLSYLKMILKILLLKNLFLHHLMRGHIISLEIKFITKIRT